MRNFIEIVITILISMAIASVVVYFNEQRHVSKDLKIKESDGELQILIDSRDGKTYMTVQIGEQVWMAENLNYNGDGSVGRCYNDNLSNCKIYGRHYNWFEAVEVCPAGWHLPSYPEWETLYKHIGGSEYFSHIVENKLKARNGWKKEEKNELSGNGTDDYGFSALPAGLLRCKTRIDCTGDKFRLLGNTGFWWTATEESSENAKFLAIPSNNSASLNKKAFFSVRCVKD